jgi:hypothetical protein
MGSKRPNDGIVLMPRAKPHDASVPHAFNHSDGHCPKCSYKGHQIVFCGYEGRDRQPAVSACELDGEHLHRQCGACGYCWVERCFDQFTLAQENGETTVESELGAALAAAVHKMGGITYERTALEGFRGWKIQFTRDAEEHQIVVTVEAPPEGGEGEIVHAELRGQSGTPPRSVS